MRIHYVTIGMASTLHGSLELARRLSDRGHQVTLLSHADIGSDVRAAQLPFVRLRDPGGGPDCTAATPAPLDRPLDPRRWWRWWRARRRARARSLSGHELGRALADADCILLDMECHYGIIASARLGIPRVLINFFFDVRFAWSVPPLSSDLTPPRDTAARARVVLAVARARLANVAWRWRERARRSGLARPLRAVTYATVAFDDVRALARAHGLDWSTEVDTGQWLRPAVYPGIPVLCLNLAELDFRHPEPADLIYVGPMVRQGRDEPRMSGADRARWQTLCDGRAGAPGRRLVYCSLGTYYAPRLGLLQRLIEGFHVRPDWDLVVGLGGRALPEPLRDVPDNVLILPWAPQSEVLAAADCAILHGGISGANESVWHRVPVLFYCGGHIDQPGVVARLVHAGVAARGDPDRDDARIMTRRIDTLCADAAVAERLRRCAGLMAEHQARDSAVAAIESVMTAQPRRRSAV